MNHIATVDPEMPMSVTDPRTWPLVAALGIAACGPGPAALASGAQAQPGEAALSAGKAYLIAPTTSVTADSPGVCLDVRNGARESGSLVQLWGCSGDDGQRFTRVGNNLQIFDKLCLAVAEGREVPGGGVQLDACDPDSLNQGWLLEGDQMQLEGTSLCLEVVNGISTPGGAVVLASCNADAVGQRFGLDEADALTGPGSPGSRRRAPAGDSNDQAP